MSLYQLNKTYHGTIKRFIPKKDFGFIASQELGDIFFHLSRFYIPTLSVELEETVRFKLVYAKKHPGKVAATEIEIVPPSATQNILRLGQIDDDSKFVDICNILNGEKDTSGYYQLSQLVYENATPLYKLRLWIKKFVQNFDFDLFKKYHFRLHRQEAAEFKKYVKENIKETKRLDFRFLGNSILIHEDEVIKTYETSWRDIGFDDKKIWINIGTTSILQTEFRCNFSRDDFNLIVTGYIAKKDLKSIISKVQDNKIIAIEGLEQLKEAIWTIERTRGKRLFENKLSEGLTIRQIRELPEFVTLSNEDILRLFGNHDCIDFLQKMQSTSFDMPLIYLVEKRPTDLSRFTIENSYLFSIILPNNTIAIVWESVKLDRATQVFVCREDEYFEVIKHIDDYLSSIETKKRSTLKSTTDEGKLLREKFKYRTSVEHTEYDIEKWKRNLLKAIPELRDAVLQSQ